MPSEPTNEPTRREWRELGFFYDMDEAAREWRLVGSRSGLLRLRDLLLAYTADARNQSVGEHEHYGPYQYLKVTTCPEPSFDDQGVRGSPGDLERLARLVEASLQDARAGSRIRIREGFAAESPYTLVLEVRPDDFDPSAADSALPGLDAASIEA
jgi:hypothetical protein